MERGVVAWLTLDGALPATTGVQLLGGRRVDVVPDLGLALPTPPAGCPTPDPSAALSCTNTGPGLLSSADCGLIPTPKLIHKTKVVSRLYLKAGCSDIRKVYCTKWLIY